MARIRTIKPEFPQSESMGRVSRDARLTFIMLWTIADDSGRLRGNSRMLASLLFPYDDDSKDLIDGWLQELEQEGCIARYVVESSSYVQILNWLDHQKIDKPSPSKLPEFDESSRIIANVRECSSEDQGRDQGPKENILPPNPQKGERKKRGRRSQEGGELGNYPSELQEAVSTWRELLKALKDPEVQERFPPEKRFLPSGVGTQEATWQAWQKHLGRTVQGHPVTNADVLSAVQMWAQQKLRLAQEGESLAAKMLPAMINSPDFVDAVVRSVKARIAAQEVEHAS
jgi:hypothetical protein